ncbi:MAG TPA: hypothetical protein HPP94_14155 [Desulfuromonadales bacterium]|nr:hypothetical protein [Desulfuromonadales bacterium]
MKLEPAPFWATVHTGALHKIDSQQHRIRLEDRVLVYLHKTNPSIYTGADNATFTSKDAEYLFRQLKKQSQTLEYLYMLGFLIKGLEAGKITCGWKNVYIPSMPVPAGREPARFTPLSFRSLNSFKMYHDAIAVYLEQEPDDSPSRHLGLILLSAIMYGGLLTSKWITALLRGLPDRVRMENGLMWVDMQRPYIYPKLADEPEKTKYINRRWFPDPLTQSLIIRLHLHYSEHLTWCHQLDAQQTCLKAILYRLSGTSTHFSIKNLYEAAACYLGLRIPGFLVSYATCKSISVSVPSNVWTRLLSDKSVIDDHDIGSSKEDISGSQKTVIYNDNVDMLRQEKLRKQLTSILGDARRTRLTCKPTSDKVQLFLEKNMRELSPVMQMLGQWAVELLTRLPNVVHGRKRKTALQPSSVATYLQAIDQELIACAGRSDITQYEPTELRDLYDDAINSAKGKQRQATSFRLTQFHRFLMRNYGTPEIDMSGMVSSSGPPELGVDANLISPSQFRLVQKALGCELPKRSRLQTIQCLIVILGYKCGLRRDEALSLRIVDLMGTKLPEVIIRTSRLFRPKTPDSTRRIPVWLLLDPDELAMLMNWKQLRIAEENRRESLTAFLFGTPGSNNIPNEGAIYLPIQASLHQVTGDATSRYHHLRHSFANRILIMLLPDNLFHESLPNALKEMRVDQKTRERIIQGLFGNMDQGRQFLYGLSSLLGHAEVSTTMQSYFHLTDWLLGQAVRGEAVQPSLSVKAVMQITGLKRAMVFRSKSQIGAETWKMEAFIERFSKHAASLFPDQFAKKTRVPLAIQPECDTVFSILPDWALVEHSLRQHQEHGMTTDDIARMLCLPSDMVLSWCMWAENIRNLTTKGGTPRHLSYWQRKSKGDTANIVLFPPPPDYPADKEIVNKILKKVAKLSLLELEDVKNGCLDFINRYSVIQGYARFTEFKGAIEFRNFLKLIGVPDSMVYVSLFAKTSPPKPEELEEHREVMKKLGIAEDHKLSSNKRHIRYRYRRIHECSVGFMVARSDHPITRWKKVVEVVTVYGFRYAVYLLAIGLAGINTCSEVVPSPSDDFPG